MAGSETMNDIHQIKMASIWHHQPRFASHMSCSPERQVRCAGTYVYNDLGARLHSQPSRITDTSQYFVNGRQVKNPHRRLHLQQALQNLGQKWPFALLGALPHPPIG
ncbi:hypothetical protein GGI35DRAFT_357027 [Trichoderma velutinum]